MVSDTGSQTRGTNLTDAGFLKTDPQKRFNVFDEIFQGLDAKTAYNSYFNLSRDKPSIIHDAIRTFERRLVEIRVNHRSGLCAFRERYKGPQKILTIIAELEREIKICRETSNIWISLIDAYYDSKPRQSVNSSSGTVGSKQLHFLFSVPTPMQIAATCPINENLISNLKHSAHRVQVWQGFLEKELNKNADQNITPGLGAFLGPVGMERASLYRQLIEQFASPCIERFGELYGYIISKMIALLIPDNDCSGSVLELFETVNDTKA